MTTHEKGGGAGRGRKRRRVHPIGFRLTDREAGLLARHRRPDESIHECARRVMLRAAEARRVAG